MVYTSLGHVLSPCLAPGLFARPTNRYCLLCSLFHIFDAHIGAVAQLFLFFSCCALELSLEEEGKGRVYRLSVRPSVQTC